MAKPGSVPAPAGFPINFNFNQFLKGLAISFTDLVTVPYINPTVVAPLASGASAHLIDGETGLPYLTTPKGYNASLLQYEWTNNQDIEVAYYVDGVFFAYAQIGNAGESGMLNPNVTVNTGSYDPQGQNSHLWDVVVYNKGLDVLKGGVDFEFLLQDIGTPPLPTVKDCKCPFCGTVQSLPVETTKVICSKCSKLYMLRYYPKNKVLMGGK
jgi:hypothetical protein